VNLFELRSTDNAPSGAFVVVEHICYIDDGDHARTLWLDGGQQLFEQRTLEQLDQALGDHIPLFNIGKCLINLDHLVAILPSQSWGRTSSAIALDDGSVLPCDDTSAEDLADLLAIWHVAER
jgi:hypothetical protein